MYEEIHIFTTFYIHYNKHTNHATQLNSVLYTKELRSNTKKKQELSINSQIILKLFAMVADTKRDWRVMATATGAHSIQVRWGRLPRIIF